MITIKFERNKGRAAAYDSDKIIGESTFSDSKNLWIIDHTTVEDGYTGQGIAKQLVEAIVDAARQEGIQLTATCPYALKLFSKSHDYDDVLLR
ncbi:GNAT family N-acetyltransferase [Peptoniphilus equinus]|uniref:GNAT family N-acetyltransferase n=1 Tax=Peptoniphilus equinus TaxID=3016343 RepID=A0ABY7QUQ0_9FIRM|nr:GNAT family N-acetyltransferase [Peptoniphilus equinus]WBW50499.1 GNAT family N-acetyltransferase [Peptoniphilus equinus]